MSQMVTTGPADLNDLSPRASDKDRERDRDKDKDRSGKRDSKAAKDLSHVPCKFFRVGGCTAGPACPFAHVSSEGGQQKSVCTWFVKGSCKFGHKCALAHVMPGQPMSMDRRNKKAAQALAGTSGGGKGVNERSGKQGGKSSHSGQSRERNEINSPGTSPASGSRLLSSRPPITISKALPTVSTQVPATSELADADFSFGLRDDLPQAVPNPTASPPMVQRQPITSPDLPVSEPQQRKPSPLPFSQPTSGQRVPRANNNPSGDFDYGPIGSPPRSSGFQPRATDINVVRSNGFSPGTSPTSHQFDATTAAGGALGTSPFSAPGSRSLFMAYSVDRDHSGFAGMGAHAASFSDRSALMSIREGGSWNPTMRGGMPGHVQGGSAVADDDGFEEFLPSSLNELLTPVERERRRSRTGGIRPTIESHHQRFSHSVPAPSLLDNVKALWDDQNRQQTHYNPMTMGGWNREMDGPSPSLLSPSNASAAFLPSAHRPVMQNMRHSSSQSLDYTNNFSQSDVPLSSSQGPPPTRINEISASQYGLHQNSRPIPGAPGDFGPLSPSARVLRSHEPGQSLPKGLAAGLSRLHLQPATNHQSNLHDWSPEGPRMGAGPAQKIPAGNNYEYPRSSLSPTRASGGMASIAIPPNGGIRRPWLGHTLSSPLSRPVPTNDADDGLFSMDEEGH